MGLDPNELNAGPAKTGTDAGEASSKPSSDAGRSFFGNLVRGFRSVDDPEREVARAKGDDSQEKSPENGEAKPDGEDKPKDGAGAGDKPGEPYKVYATKEEHDRDIQAEQDRREARRAERQQAQDAAAERRRLRQEDPAAYAAQDEEREATVAMASNIVDTYDQSILVPMLMKLPEDKRAEVVNSIDSVPARIKALETVVSHVSEEAYKKGLAEGEAKARKNPTVRKEIIRDMREDGADPPELIEHAGSGASGDGPNAGMNAFLRRGARLS